MLPESEPYVPDKATVKVKYTGRLRDGTIFDSSREPFEFRLGENKVIQGWELSMPYLKKGQKAILTIPAELGYGKKGVP